MLFSPQFWQLESRWICIWSKVISFFFFFPSSLKHCFKTKCCPWININIKTMPTYNNNKTEKKFHTITTSVHPLLLNLRRENALTLSQSKGQGSARFSSEQICTNKYIICSIIHSVAEWQSGAFFFFFSPPSEQLARRTIRKGNFKTDHSVILTRWRIFEVFQNKTLGYIHHFTILQFTNSRKRVDVWISLGAVCMETLLAGSLLKKNKKKQTNKKKRGDNTKSQGQHGYVKHGTSIQMKGGFGRSRFTPCTVVPSKHAKHPYTDTKNNQCLTKNHLNTNLSSTAGGWRGRPAESGAGWDPAGLHTR